MSRVHFHLRGYFFSNAFSFRRSQKTQQNTTLTSKFVAAFSSECVSMYGHKIHVHACESIHKNISNNNTLTRLASLQDEQYFLYCVLQSRLYASSSPSYSLFEATKHSIIHTRIIESVIHSLNPISLRLLFDYNAIYLIDQHIQSKTTSSSSTPYDEPSARSLIEKAITADSTYSLLALAANRMEQQQLNQLISYSELLTRVESALNSRILSLSNQQFANLLEALAGLFESSSCNEFRTEIEANHAKTFKQISTKLLQYTRTRDLLLNNNDIEYLPQILHASARLSRFSALSIVLSSESLGFFDKILSSKFKYFSSRQLVSAAAAFLTFTSPEKSSSATTAGSFHSKFLDTFYFTLLKSTPFYTKEYLTRKLGIANTSFNDQPLGKLLRTALTRLYLINVRSMQPPFEKQIAFSFSEKCTLISNLVQNTHFKDSPLITMYLQEIISQIRSSYLLDIISDPAIEADHYEMIVQATHSLATISITRGDQFMNDDVNAQELRDLILTFFFRHSNKFMQSVNSMFDLIEIAGRISIIDGTPSENKHMSLYNQLLRIKITEFLAQENFSQPILSQFSIFNNQNEYFGSLMGLFAGVLQNNIDDCLPFFAKVTDNITQLNMENTLTFLDTSLSNLIESISFRKLLLNRFSHEQFRSHFHSNFECHIKLLTAYLTAINKSQTSNQFRVNRLLLSNEVDSLLENASPADINQSNVELAIDFLLASGTIDGAQLEFDAFESVFFRIIADKHSTFALNAYESIVTKCMQLENIAKNFDDGSECYPICLLDELSQYNRDKFSQFTQEFKDIIQPFIKQDDNATGVGSLLDKCFDTISSTAQVAQQFQQQSQQQNNNNLNSNSILKEEEKEGNQSQFSQKSQEIK